MGLYIHIPFCDTKCPYCDFYSITINDSIVDSYVNAVCECIEYWAQKTRLVADTLYIGGGTPSIIGENKISKIVKKAKESFYIDNGEMTIEINPREGKSLDFKMLKDVGVNRLSIGLQSANNNELELLSRRHSVQDVKDTILLAQKAGFDNISLDLMVGISGQTRDSLSKSIEFCVSQNVQHISAYLLKIEEGTKYFVQRKNLVLPNEDEVSSFYLFLCNKLEKFDFKQYEISNFSLEGKESKHNLKYWNLKNYIGIGPSAHSFLNGDRFYYNSNINNFINDFKYTIYDCKGGSEEEYIMLKLRLASGLNNEEFKIRFGYNIPIKYFKRAKIYEKYSLLNINKNSISLTNKGFLLSNKIISQIIY